MALLYADIKCELREVELKDKPEDMLRVSETQTVPILILKDGHVIEESLDIALWALEQTDSPFVDSDVNASSLRISAPGLLVEKAASLELIKTNDDDFKHWLDRYKYHVGYPDHPQSYYQSKAEIFVADLERRLSKSKFLLGSVPRLADIAIFPFVRQFAFVDIEWFSNSKYVSTRDWLESWLETEQFNTCMTKYTKWQPDSSLNLFPG